MPVRRRKDQCPAGTQQTRDDAETCCGIVEIFHHAEKQGAVEYAGGAGQGLDRRHLITGRRAGARKGARGGDHRGRAVDAENVGAGAGENAAEKTAAAAHVDPLARDPRLREDLRSEKIRAPLEAAAGVASSPAFGESVMIADRLRDRMGRSGSARRYGHFVSRLSARRIRSRRCVSSSTRSRCRAISRNSLCNRNRSEVCPGHVRDP